MNAILELKNITKAYPGVVALNNVSLSIEEGEIHALMGENGAGKSTLIKVISGAVQADNGNICVNSQVHSKMTPALSRKEGIGVIYQEFNLVPSMSVAENVCLGDKIGGHFTADFLAMHQKTAAVFKEFNVPIHTYAMVATLSTAQQQLVEIAKAIVKNAKILIMDEPSAALSIAEVDKLFEIIAQLKKKGVTIIYISHRIDEVFQISDRVTVMRDGVYIGTKKTADTSRKELVEMMVGRELNEEFPKRSVKLGDIVLDVEGLYGNGDSNISFQLHKGEILGVAGLVGAGRTELAKVLYGAAKLDNGIITLRGKSIRNDSPFQAIENGIGLIPEDRKREGVFLDFTIRWNIALMSLKRLSKFTVVDEKKVEQLVKEYVDRLHIKTPSVEQAVRNLSGGNQQKVVLAKTIATNTSIIIFDEPTRGIDVGAKHEIYALMNELTQEGVSIIMISSEMEELIGMSDRMIVLHEGKLTGAIERDQFSQQRILEMASNM